MLLTTLLACELFAPPAADSASPSGGGASGDPDAPAGLSVASLVSIETVELNTGAGDPYTVERPDGATLLSVEECDTAFEWCDVADETYRLTRQELIFEEHNYELVMRVTWLVIEDAE